MEGGLLDEIVVFQNSQHLLEVTLRCLNADHRNCFRVLGAKPFLMDFKFKNLASKKIRTKYELQTAQQAKIYLVFVVANYFGK